MTRLPLALVAALAASPALAEAPPSDAALGVAMGQWVILNCRDADIPLALYGTVQMMLPMIPQVEQDKAFSMVAESLAQVPTSTGCDLMLEIVRQSLPPNT